jgi:hypothetical protein
LEFHQSDSPTFQNIWLQPFSFHAVRLPDS